MTQLCLKGLSGYWQFVTPVCLLAMVHGRLTCKACSAELLVVNWSYGGGISEGQNPKQDVVDDLSVHILWCFTGIAWNLIYILHLLYQHFDTFTVYPLTCRSRSTAISHDFPPSHLGIRRGLQNAEHLISISLRQGQMKMITSGVAKVSTKWQGLDGQ